MTEDPQLTEEPELQPAAAPETMAPSADSAPLAPAAEHPAETTETEWHDDGVSLPDTVKHVDWSAMMPQKTPSMHDLEMAPVLRTLPTSESEPPAAMQEPSPEPAAEEKAEPKLIDAKEDYWSRVLTGNPDTVPQELRQRVGADDALVPEEEREYELLSAINRSWYADHHEESREQVAGQWPQLRSQMTEQLGVADDESELFDALSQQRQEESRRAEAESIYQEAYLSALRGETAEPVPAQGETAPTWQEALRRRAAELGSARREELKPMGEKLGRVLACMQRFEDGTLDKMVRIVADVPLVSEVFGSMVDMDEGQRRELYEIARTMLPPDSRKAETDSLLSAMWQSAKRGVSDMRYGLIQAAGNLAASSLQSVSRLPHAEGALKLSKRVDSYMRLVEEMRRFSEEEAYPIRLEEDAGLPEELALEVTRAAPAAAASFCGGAGFALSMGSGLGLHVADMRQQAPEGNIELQTGAGMLVFGVQAGIAHGLNSMGARLFDRTMNRFAHAAGSGIKGYSVRALGAGTKVAGLTIGGIRDVHVGRVTDMAAREMVAKLDGTASNVNWKEYGENWDDMEWNLREAARNLPYILIGSGRVALHHFSNPRAVVGEEPQLAEWGIDEPTRRLVLNEPDVRRQGQMLYEALHNGKRWGGLGFLQDAARSLRLLHTDDFHLFEKPENVRDFMNLPPETSAPNNRRLVLRNPEDPEALKTLSERHAGGKEFSDPKRALPLLLLSEEWLRKAFPKDMEGYPTANELAPAELCKLGDHSPQTEAQRRAAVDRTIKYLDALSYRFLVNSSSYGSLRLDGRSADELRAAMDGVRSQLMGKVAESVLLRAGGATPAESDELFGRFLSDYYSKQRHYSGFTSWLRYIEPKRLSELHIHGLSERAFRRGPNLRRGKFPELQHAYWMLQGLHHSIESLVRLLPHQADFQAAIARGMTPQESYAHLLHREMGSRLPQSDWFPQQLTEDVTDRGSMAEKNRTLAENYRRLTGVTTESTEGADGRTLWRIQTPDGHYTHWHDKEDHALSELVVNARMRYLPLGFPMQSELLTAGTGEEGFDAAKVGLDRPWLYSYFDRLSAIASGDLTRFWQEDSTRMVPGASPELFRDHSSYRDTLANPYFRADEANPGMWLVDERSVRSPYSVAKARFETYWRNRLFSGWLEPQEALDFLTRRKVIDDAEKARLEELGEVRVRHVLTPAIFFSGEDLARFRPYADLDGLRNGLSRHLANYTTGYFLAHLKEMPMPDSVREWFALAPFRPEYALRRSGHRGTEIRTVSGHRDSEQTMKWTHQSSAEQVNLELDLADRIRAEEQESGPESLSNDPFFPLMYEALELPMSRRTEQGWGYVAGGTDIFRQRHPELWNLLEEPERGWHLLSEDSRETLRRRAPQTLGEPDAYVSVVPEPLLQLADALRKYPELRRYDFVNGDENRLLRMDIPELEVPTYKHAGNPFERLADHGGDGVIRSGFDLTELSEYPEPLRSDEQLRRALHTLSSLRRAVVDFPYADKDGVWWDGVPYGGADGNKLPGMEDDWVAHRPMSEITRLFGEMPEDGSAVLNLGVNDFSARPSLPENAFSAMTVYRSPEYPLSQLRLMPGDRFSQDSDSRNPYVVQSFVGAPMRQGFMLRNGVSGGFFFQPLQSFMGDVSKEYVGHMAGWRGHEALDQMLDSLMMRTKSAEDLEASRYDSFPNSEILMQLTEDSRFDRSLQGRSPHELNPDEALAATWFYALARYQFGKDSAEAAQELLAIHNFMEEHPERMESMKKMLNEHRLWYDLDPGDVWVPVAAASAENRHFKAVRREMEMRKAMEEERRAAENLKRYRDEMMRVKHGNYIHRTTSDDY
ncbi:MAG: hypothetical protein MJ051_01385 [Akkermansia sp.]|nr:hypothetical protein [Akkermansia sp.]